MEMCHLYLTYRIRDAETGLHSRSWWRSVEWDKSLWCGNRV